MIKRSITFRRTLPCIMTMLYVWLVFSGDTEEYLDSQRNLKSQWRIGNQEGDRCEYLAEMAQSDWYIPYSVPKLQVAGVLNGPALLIGAMVLYTPYNALYDRCRHLNLIYWSALPFVPILWYLIGRYVDGFFGLIEVRVKRSRRLQVCSVICGTIFTSLAVCIGLLGGFKDVIETVVHGGDYFFKNHWFHRPFAAVGALLWCSIIALVAFRTAWNSKAIPRGYDTLR